MSSAHRIDRALAQRMRDSLRDPASATANPFRNSSRLGHGLVSFRALFNNDCGNNQPLSDPSGHILHVIVPDLNIAGIPASQLHALQSCINRDSMLPNNAGFSFVPLDTLQDVWICVASTLGLLENASDTRFVTQTLGRVLEEAYIAAINDPLDNNARAEFELTCTTLHFRATNPAAIGTSPFYTSLFHPARQILPRGVYGLLHASSYPEPIPCNPRIPLNIIGFHRPLSLWSFFSSDPVNLAANLSNIPNKEILLLAHEKLVPEFSSFSLRPYHNESRYSALGYAPLP